MNKLPRQKIHNTARAFTLLEMVFVLTMVAVLTTWMTLSVSTVETERKLREAAGAIESLAKRGRNIAVKQRRAYQLTIGVNEISIAPHHPLGSDKTHFLEDSKSEDEFSAERFDDIIANELVDDEVTYEVKRWRSDDWDLMEGDKKAVIILDPIGLVEPISIRCTMGKSWLIQDIHPLTAGIRDEQMSIEKE